MLRLSVILSLAGILAISGCGSSGPARTEYPVGERVRVGPLTYYVIESRSASQVGDLLKLRPAQDRSLMISLSITNGSGNDVSVPLLEVENPNGQLFKESENGEGVSNWM